MKLCIVEGCGKKMQARELCNTHYWRWNQYGDALYEGPRNKAGRIRKIAIENGETTYQAISPCLRGHLSKRVIDGQCVECRTLLSKEKYRSNPTPRLIASAKWRASNIEYHRALVSKWEKKNRDRKNEHRAKRRAIEKSAMPEWADRKKIAKIYQEARKKGLVVDHDIPLNSPVVCGLHVPENLKLLTEQQNKSKHNKFDVDKYVAAGAVV